MTQANPNPLDSMNQEAPAAAISVNEIATHSNILSGTALRERQPRTLKYGDIFGVFDHNGDVDTQFGNPEGLFFRDTRYLSRLVLSICGRPLSLLCSTLRDDNGGLTCDLSNPDLFHDSRLLLEHDLLHIRRFKFLWEDTCFERLAIRNYSGRREHVRLEVEFAADFADVFEVRGAHRVRRGVLDPGMVEPDAVTLAYTGLDQRRRETRLRFSPQPAQLEASKAIFEFDLEPHGRAILFIEIRCDSFVPTLAPGKFFYISALAARRARRAAVSRAAAIVSSNAIFNEAIQRAVSDLYMLITDGSEGPYPYAGIPWFSAVFGRDGLIVALQTLWLDSAIARGVLGLLAANQARSENDATDAEPGKILHEMRHGEMAELGEVPFGCYYGSVDATPLFVMLAGAYLERTGDKDFLAGLWPHIAAALEWIDVYGDRDHDGFVEYGRKNQRGLMNQGWKDSNDSIFHADGTAACGPIALVEVQAYVYAAKRAAAVIAGCLGDVVHAGRLNAQAEELRLRFDVAFWDESLGTYVLALDGDKRPCRVRTSNAGHALFTGIALPERAERLVQTLMQAASFSGWGIRTVAASEARYNPMSYHNGSVWPHDNAIIAHGFMRYGFGHQAAQILKGLFDASTYIPLRRLPELFCGFSRARGQGPTFYPLACSPQAWAATAPLFLLQSCLGLDFDPKTRHVTFNHPILPEFLDDVMLRGLAIGEARVDVMVRRAQSLVTANVVSRTGDIHMTIRS
jgi:glycogen debranching enzyme